MLQLYITPWMLPFLEDIPFFCRSSFFTGSATEEVPEDPNLLPRLVPLFESPLKASFPLPPVISADPLQVYSRRPPAKIPLLIFSLELGNSLMSRPIPQTCGNGHVARHRGSSNYLNNAAEK